MSDASVLVVDDEKSMRDLLAISLEKQHFDVTVADGGEPAIDTLRREAFDVVITDLRMPTVDGLQVLRAAKEASPESVVIVITAVGSTETAVEAMKLGAYDYITKPFKLDEINLIIRRALERKRLRDENLYLRKQLETQHRFDNIVGKSARMAEVFETIRKIADSPSTVMITGESGTGKELVARAIHFNGGRPDKPFVSVNCGAIPEALMESELFGHVKGAFTGAIANKIGLFSAADGGHACSSTRSPRSRPCCRSSCCARSRSARSGGSATPATSRSTCGSSPPPTATSRKRWRRACSGRISSTG